MPNPRSDVPAPDSPDGQPAVFSPYPDNQEDEWATGLEREKRIGQTNAPRNVTDQTAPDAQTKNNPGVNQPTPDNNTRSERQEKIAARLLNRIESRKQKNKKHKQSANGDSGGFTAVAFICMVRDALAIFFYIILLIPFVSIVSTIFFVTMFLIILGFWIFLDNDFLLYIISEEAWRLRHGKMPVENMAKGGTKQATKQAGKQGAKQGIRAVSRSGYGTLILCIIAIFIWPYIFFIKILRSDYEKARAKI